MTDKQHAVMSANGSAPPEVLWTDLPHDVQLLELPSVLRCSRKLQKLLLFVVKVKSDQETRAHLEFTGVGGADAGVAISRATCTVEHRQHCAWSAPSGPLLSATAFLFYGVEQAHRVLTRLG